MAKEIKIVYDGAATVTGVDAKMFKEYDGGLGKWIFSKLGAEDREDAFMMQVHVKAGDVCATIELEWSHRELAGKIMEKYQRADGKPPTQVDMLLAELRKRGLVSGDGDERDVTMTAFDPSNVGKSVNVQVYQEADGNGGFYRQLRARFAFGGEKPKWLQAKLDANAPKPIEAAASGDGIGSDADDIPF